MDDPVLTAQVMVTLMLSMLSTHLTSNHSPLFADIAVVQTIEAHSDIVDSNDTNCWHHYQTLLVSHTSGSPYLKYTCPMFEHEFKQQFNGPVISLEYLRRHKQAVGRAWMRVQGMY